MRTNDRKSQLSIKLFQTTIMAFLIAVTLRPRFLFGVTLTIATLTMCYQSAATQEQPSLQVANELVVSSSFHPPTVGENLAILSSVLNDGIALSALPGSTTRVYVHTKSKYENGVRWSITLSDADPGGKPPVVGTGRISFVQYWLRDPRSDKFIVRSKHAREKLIWTPQLLTRNPDFVRRAPNGRSYSLGVSDSGSQSYIVDVESQTHNRHNPFDFEKYPLNDLRDTSSVEIPHNEFLSLLVEIPIPYSTTAAVYSGQLLLTPSIGNQVRVPLKVTVGANDLRPATRAPLIYYLGRLSNATHNTLPHVHKSETQLLADFEEMRSAGIRNFTVYQTIDDARLFKRYLELRTRAGFPDDELYIVDFKLIRLALAGEIDALTRRLVRLRRLVHELSASEIFLYGKDEASSEEFRKQIAAFNRYKELGFKIFASMPHAAVADALPWVDLFVLPHAPNDISVRLIHDKNKKVFSYDNPQSGLTNGVLYRQNYGLLLWAYDYDGAMPYAFQDAFGDIWADVDHTKYRDHVFVYPSASEPIITVPWVAFQEGITDLRYIATLETTISELRSSTIGLSCIPAHTAETYLLELKNKIRLKRSSKRTQSLNLPLDAIRQSVIDHIENIAHGCQARD